MAALILPKSMTAEEKIEEMRELAKFDVGDTAGSDNSCIPDASLLDVEKSKKNPPKVPKMFVSGSCVFNCAYCGCRNSREKQSCCNQPKELARLAVEEAKRNGHGVFISSAIYKNADYTEELIIDTIKRMRLEHDYTGYIHAKIMPGASPELIKEAGLYADRLSVNIEVAKSEGYGLIAKQKNKRNILVPMKQISDYIAEAKEAGRSGKLRFAASQTTQLMAGSTGEDDRTILRLAKNMYGKYGLKRVYYTAFHYTHPAKGYENLKQVKTPLWRMKRLYQADRLMELYDYAPDEIAPEKSPFLQEDIDPKLSWALLNIELFPVELNTADYETLLRVPGIGIIYAKKIINMRKFCSITPEVLTKMGVSLKRCIYFVQFGGKYRAGSSAMKPEQIKKILSSHEIPPAEQLAFW